MAANLLHVFCPSFPAPGGVYSFEPIDAPEAVKRIQAAGVSSLRWRHTWPAVRHLLRGLGLDIRANVDQGATVKRSPPFDVGQSQSALIFKPVGRADLKSKALEAADFEIVFVVRLE